MRKLTFVELLVIVFACGVAFAGTNVRALSPVTMAVAGERYNLSSTTVNADTVTIGAGQNNTGSFYVQANSGIAFNAQDTITLTAVDNGMPIDLSTIGVYGTVNNDTVGIIYTTKY